MSAGRGDISAVPQIFAKLSRAMTPRHLYAYISCFAWGGRSVLWGFSCQPWINKPWLVGVVRPSGSFTRGIRGSRWPRMVQNPFHHGFWKVHSPKNYWFRSPRTCTSIAFQQSLPEEFVSGWFWLGILGQRNPKEDKELPQPYTTQKQVPGFRFCFGFWVPPPTGQSFYFNQHPCQDWSVRPITPRWDLWKRKDPHHFHHMVSGCFW